MHLLLSRYIITAVVLLIVLVPVQISAQEIPDYDEISVFLDIPRVGGGEIDAVIRGGELYLPVTDLFDFLKIRNVPTQELESVSGFFINPDATYTISRSENLIRYQDKTFNLAPGDLIRTESDLYLRSSYYGKVFGLECVFNFRSLSVTVNSKLELPLIREMRQEEMRRNISRLKGEVKADTTIGRTHPLFKFGMADWSAIATEEIKGKSDTRLNLALGSMIAGGEATASINYSSTDPFTEKQQYYLWRYVNNDFSPLRQAMAGKIATHATSSIYNPVVGIQLTNTPTTFRRSFGSYTLSDKTEPGWVVELFVNNVLVDYVKADASGFFTFEVPLVYGNLIVKLKYFGPWGEERTREQNINIPFNFLPKNTMEYIVSAGVVEDSVFSRFSRTSINYGATRNLTLGGGVEYLSSVKSGPAMPYLNASLRMFNNLLFSGEYTYGVRAKGTFTYRLASNLQFDLNYTKYNKDQKAISYNYLEERKAVVSMPIRIGKFSSYQRLTLYQIVLPSSKYTTGEWMFSGSLFGVNTNLTTYALFIGDTKPYIYSNLSMAFRLPAGIVFMPQAQYGYTENKLLSMRLGLEKHLWEHAFLNISYEQNFKNDLKMGELGFRYDFKFAQTGASVRQSNNKTTLVQYARGSLINDRKTRYLGADNRTNVGKGGITILAYLDINANRKRDPGEPKAYGLNLHTNGGRIEKSDRDTTIRILGLEPYTNCFIDLDPNSFENITWRLPIQTLSVAVDPDILKNIEIPVTVAGEASGMVNLEQNGEKRGLGRIIISFYNSNLKQAGKTLTEEDGYFSYFGLAPGSYFVRVDTAQLRKLQMISETETLKFDITAGIDGDIADGLNFMLKMKPSDTEGQETPIVSEQQVVKKDTTYTIVHEVTQELLTIGEDSYAIQLGAFKERANAEAYRMKIESLLGRKVEIVIDNDFYKVRINAIKDREEVDNVIAILNKFGVTELWVIKLKAKQQQWVLTEKQDTVINIIETITTKPDLTMIPELPIQLRAMRVFEDEFYKLPLAGIPLIDQTVIEVMKKSEPEIGKFGLKDRWQLPIQKQPDEEPAIRQLVAPVKPVEWKKEISSVVNHDGTTRLIEEKLVVPAVPPEPTISIQAGIFTKRSDALRAQRRISARLKLPVEIVQQYEYYKVIIPGFYSREETYKYYPELAGLGYPGISLIEKIK